MLSVLPWWGLLPGGDTRTLKAPSPCILNTMGGQWGSAGAHVCASEMSRSQIRLIKSIES